MSIIFCAYSNPDSAVNIVKTERRGYSTSRLSRVWALALPCTRIDNSSQPTPRHIARNPSHAHSIRADSVQYTWCGRFGCAFFLYIGICEIHTQKITFVNVLYHKNSDPQAHEGCLSRLLRYEKRMGKTKEFLKKFWCSITNCLPRAGNPCTTAW